MLGTQPAGPLEFEFAVSDGCSVQLDEVIAVDVQDPADPARTISFYGVVDAVTRRFEGVHFDGDTKLVTEGTMPAHVSYVAKVRTTRVEPEEFIPPAPGDPVRLARGDTLLRALFADRMERSIPAGVLRNGEAAFLNLDFIDGTKGAHINISGISGVATKTSYALFLLYSLFNARSGGGLVLPDAANSRAVIFNVKGHDLFWLDRPNNRYLDSERDWAERNGLEADRYGLLGLPAAPFESVQVRSPALAAHGRGADLLPEMQDDPRVLPYCFSLREFAADSLLPFMLTSQGDMTNLAFLTDSVTGRLEQLARSQKTAGPWLEVDDWPAAGDDAPAGGRIGMFEEVDPEALSGGGSTRRLTTLAELVDYIEYRLLDADDGDGDARWYARQPRSTREALIRRLRGAARHLGRLVRGDVSAAALERARPEVLDSGSQIHVIDIHSLPQAAQMFVVGVLLRRIFARRETGSGDGKVFVVLDELNKYAPAEGEGPIKDVMLDIAERGRSLGVILIGAQQTASEVERRIVSNAAVRVTGRLDSAEAERSEYRFLPASMRQRATILTPGMMMVSQPDIPTPLLLSFPFSAWATRFAETFTKEDPHALSEEFE